MNFIDFTNFLLLYVGIIRQHLYYIKLAKFVNNGFIKGNNKNEAVIHLYTLTPDIDIIDFWVYT